MPTATVKFHVLDVGQGACNYVEILDGQNAVTHNLLIDLGTSSSQAIAAQNLQWLRQKIIDNNRYLDALIITHGDVDHYNLIAKILPAFGPPAGNQIGMVRYGGPAWRYKKGRLINILKTYTESVDGTANVGGFTANQHGFADDEVEPEWTPIWEVEGAAEPKLQLIIANTPHAHDPADLTKRQAMNAEAVNTKSVITALQWSGYWIVATGDATATTLVEVNDLLELVDQSTFPRTFMLTLPHHGSRKTTYDLKKADNIPDPAARAVISEFLDIFEPITMSASAGEKNHHHPSLYLIRQFTDKLTEADPYWSDPALGGNQHFLTSWVDLPITPGYIEPAWPARWLYATTKTRTNLYSTFYFKNTQFNSHGYSQYVCPPIPVPAENPDPEEITDIPMGRNWEFRWTAGARTVLSSDNAARAMAEGTEFFRSAPAAAAAAAPSTALLGASRGAAAPAARRPVAERFGPRLRGLRTIR